MGDKLMMSEKERTRKAVLESVKQKDISLKKASERLQISYRQAKRVWKRYCKGGDEALLHRSRGKISNRRKPAKFRLKVIKLYQEHYLGFGPLFASEKLAERDKIVIHPDTLRHWLMAEKLWERKRKRKNYRQWREPRKKFGELVQLDGSFHDWFGNGHHDCLMHMVDDATRTSLAYLASGETTIAAMEILKLWIEKYGVPQEIYVDLKTTYISPKDRDMFMGALTQFGKACAKLGIKLIKAYSPQAKGRVERKHALYQDRLVKEIKLNDIKTHKEVNHFLQAKFMPKLNQRYTIAPLDSTDGHQRLFLNLHDVLCLEEERILQNDWTIVFNKSYFQIEKTKPLLVRPKAKIIVRIYLDNSLKLFYKEHELSFHRIEKKHSVKIKASKKGVCSVHARRAGLKGKARSPWNRYNPSWLKSIDKTEKNRIKI